MRIGFSPKNQLVNSIGIIQDMKATHTMKTINDLINIKLSITASVLVACMLFSTSCNGSINQLTSEASSTAVQNLTVEYYEPNDFKNAMRSAAGSDLEINAFMTFDDYTNIQMSIWDPIISIMYYQYNDASRAINGVRTDYNEYYQGVLDDYYDGSVYYGEGDNQAYVIMNLTPTNPNREYVVSDFGVFPHYGVSCYNGDMFVSIYTIDDSEEAHERVDGILEEMGFPSPQSIPDDVVISDDFEPLPYVTSETTETVCVSDYEITPIETDLTLDEVINRWNAWAGIDMSYYPQEFNRDDNWFEYEEHSVQYEPDYLSYAEYRALPDECGIVWDPMTDFDYHTNRLLRFDDVTILEFDSPEWAEQYYRTITDQISLDGTETDDSDLVNGYCYEREVYDNGRIHFEVYYYFGNCVMIYWFDWAYHFRPDYIRYLEMCEALELPVSEQISNEILELNEDELTIYDKVDIVCGVLRELIGTEEYLGADQAQRTQMMEEVLMDVAYNGTSDYPYALFRRDRISVGETSIEVHIGDSSWTQSVYFQVTDDPDHLYTYPGSRGTYG